MRDRRDGLRACALAIVGAGVLAACGNGTSGTDTGNGQDATMDAVDIVTSPCGPDGPYGTFTNVSGGQSGITACGHTFMAFTGATLTLMAADAGSALLTVSGTGVIGDVMNCPATVNGCTVTASCSSGAGSTVAYTLSMNASQFSGSVEVMVPGPCGFPYSIQGTR